MMPLEITQGAQRMLETDPNGWILTLVSISVVFGCLLLLCGIYSLSGAIFSGAFKRKRDESSLVDEEIAAAIAMALEQELSESEVHDIEPGFITIRKTSSICQSINSR